MTRSQNSHRGYHVKSGRAHCGCFECNTIKRKLKSKKRQKTTILKIETKFS